MGHIHSKMHILDTKHLKKSSAERPPPDPPPARYARPLGIPW